MYIKKSFFSDVGVEWTRLRISGQLSTLCDDLAMWLHEWDCQYDDDGNQWVICDIIFMFHGLYCTIEEERQG